MAWACIAPLALLEAELRAPEAWCSPSEWARHQAFSLPARRQRFLAGRWFLRRLLAVELGAVPAELVLELSPSGRSLPLQGWHFSLSHSGEWLGAAIARSPIGLDLQLALPRHDWRAMAELAGLSDLSSAADFYRHWTLAEALLKSDEQIATLESLRGLRWRPSEAGPGWQGQIDDLHWAVVSEQPPRWTSALWPGALAPACGTGWAPLLPERA
jgi:hypothetical protein